jgi:hypothetical protein
MSATRGSAVNEDLEELDMKVVLLGLGVVLMMLGLASTTTARSDADREVVRVEPATVDAGGSVTFAARACRRAPHGPSCSRAGTS